MITKDKYIENDDGTFDVVVYGVWQIALLRYLGYDFDTIKIDVVENSKKSGEKGFKFHDVDERFDKILGGYHSGKELFISLDRYRGIFLNTKNILSGKITHES